MSILSAQPWCNSRAELFSQSTRPELRHVVTVFVPMLKKRQISCCLGWGNAGQMIGKEDIRATALARLRSATVLRELPGRGQSPALACLVRKSGLDLDQNATEYFGTAFDQAFSQLKRRVHRREHFDKTALMRKVPLGISAFQTVSLVTETRVGCVRQMRTS